MAATKTKMKSQTVLDRSRASDMNMAVLRRIDPEVEEVSWHVMQDPAILWLPEHLFMPESRPHADPGQLWARLPVPHERG
jgi:hypothetical protein